MTNFKGNYFKYIFFILLLIFASTTNSALALEQLKDATKNANWTKSGNLSVAENANNLELYVTGRNASANGLYYQSVRTPASRVNVYYSFEYQTYRNNRNPGTYQFTYYYGTNTTQSNGTQIVYRDRQYDATDTTSNTTQTPSGTITNLGLNTTYYFKAYLTVRTSNNNDARAGVKIYNAHVNFSPSGLAAALNTTNRTIAGSNYRIVDGVNLTWARSTSNAVTFTNYKVYRSNAENGTYSLIATINDQNTLNYLDTAPLGGTNWYYITDTGSDGIESPASVKVSINCLAPVTNIRGEMQALSGGYYYNNVLTWNAVPGFWGQYIVFGGSASNNYDRVLWSTGTTANDDNVNNDALDDTFLYYRVTYSTDSNNTWAPLSDELAQYFLFPPKNLRVTSGYDPVRRQDAIAITWNDKNIPDLISYNIYRSNTENGTYTLIGTTGNGSTAYYDVTVTAGTTYWYKVTCTTPRGTSGWSQAMSGVLMPTPKNLTATNLGGNQIRLNWTEPTAFPPNHGGYNIYRSTSPNGPWTQVRNWVSGNNFTDSISFGDGDVMYYYVAEMGWDHEGGPSNIAKVGSLDAPTNLRIAPNAAYTGLVLNWNAVTKYGAKVAGYNIYRSESAGGPYTKLGETNSRNTTTYTDTPVPVGKHYYYVVTTRNTSNGESDYSNEVDGVINFAPPTIAISTISDLSGFNITWTYSEADQCPSAMFGGYNVYRSEASGGPYTLLTQMNKTGGTSYSYSDTAVTEGVTYYYVVTTRNNASPSAESGYSNEVEGKLNFAPPTIAISALSDMSGLKLTWTYNAASQCPEARLGGYNIYRSETSGGPYAQIGSTDGKTGVTYTDTTVANAVEYYYVVRTRNVDGDESVDSNEVHGKITMPAPTLPPTITATLQSNRYLPVTINIASNYNCTPVPPGSFGGFNIYRKSAGETSFSLIGSVASTTFVYRDATAPTDEESEYYVTAFNIVGGESPESNHVKKTPQAVINLTVAKNLPNIDLSTTGTNIGSVTINWEAIISAPGATIQSFLVILWRDGVEVGRTVVTDPTARSCSVDNVFFVNNSSYMASVEAIYDLEGISASITDYSNSFLVFTPAMMDVRDGWSGKDITYSFFDNRAEANWEFADDSGAVRYEVALGTTPYGTETVGWTDVGLVNRIGIETPELASGTRYYFSVRGFNQQKNQVLSGCSDGFIARKDVVSKDTSDKEFFNNARILDKLDTDGGQLAPTAAASSNQYKYSMAVTVTEPGIIDRVNAPCLLSFDIPNGKTPTYINELRVFDDQGNMIPCYNLTTGNGDVSNSTTAHPYLVFLVNLQKGQTRTYYVYWGNGVNTAYSTGFVQNTGSNCMTAWTPYYSRLDTPAGMEDVIMQSANPSNRRLFGDDVSESIAPLNAMPNRNATVGPIAGLSRFYFFGTNKTTNWWLNSNGYIDTNHRTGYDSYTNTWEKFVGSSGNILGGCICPLWVDHMCGTAWTASGVFINNAANPNRLIYTWVTYRFGVTDDAYKFQVVLYETGDIAIRYGLVSPRALITNGSYDKAVNTSLHHTVGISRGNNRHYLYHTPLEVGINSSPTAFYQCMNAFDGNITYGDIIGDGSSYDIAHFQSMVFDTRVAAPKWIGMEYDATVTGARKILLAYRTGDTPLPDGSWTGWSTSTEVTSANAIGTITFPEGSVNGRYIQYRADFMKTSNATGNVSIQEVRFIFGGISVETITSVIDGEPVTEVSQGQKNIPVKVAVKNLSAETVALTSNEMSFTLGGHTARLSGTAFPVNIAPQGIATLSYLVDIADDAPVGPCTIDAYATASALLYDNGAQIPLTWYVNSKSQLVINEVYSPYTKVTKGFDYDIYVTITNTGDSPCMLNELFPTYENGIYTFTLDKSYDLATGTVATGTTAAVIPGRTTRTAKYLVHISTESASGSDTIGATASATNKLSGEILSVLGTDNPHVWAIQKPAELNLYNIVASSTLYRGQKNNKIIVTATNEGEAELEWYPASTTSKIVFTPITNSAKGYENLRMSSTETAITIDSATVAEAQYSIDVKSDSATGTDRITATIYGMENNTMTDLVDSSVDDIPSTDWTIYAEKVNTYNDGPCNEEADSFNKPSGSNILTIYAKVENLAANTEYMVHWYDSSNTEILTTKPKITAGQGYFIVQLDLDSTCLSGTYKVSVTDPLSLFICCENFFEIVAPAEMTASFTLPLYATVGQPITASFTYINLGGAEIANATLVPTDTVRINHLDGATNGDVTLDPDNPADAVFSPRLTEVPGNGQATATFKLIAARTGRVSLTASATGYDKNSGMSLSVPDVTSNICTIQTAPNITVAITNKSANNVYLNQKNLRVTARITNNGQATAVISAASMSFNIGTYDQELMGYTEPLEIELAQGRSVDLTFDIGVSPDSASGLDTLTANVLWHDKNWPVDKVSSGNTTWTIEPCGIMLSTDPDFNYESSDFYRGQTVYIRAFGVNPNSTYYRIRLYTSQIARAAQVPAGYKTGSDQPYSGLVGASDAGYVDHIYILPTTAGDAPIGTWSVTLEGRITNVGTTVGTLGNMMALQYFRVQERPHMTATLTLENVSIENDDKIFVGDTFRGHLTLTSTTADNNTTPAVNTGAIDEITPYELIKDATSNGGFELVSGPDPATFTLRAGESKTFEYVFRATEFTGTGVLRIKSSDANYIARGRDRNAWDHIVTSPYDIFARQQLTSNGIVIYTKSMAVSPDVIEFGVPANPISEDKAFGLVCGAMQEQNVTIQKTGNYDLDNVRANKSLLNGPVVGGVKQSISDTYFNIDTSTITNPMTAASEMTRASLTIPYFQPEGEYTSTMFVYCDSNGNGKYDSGEVTDEFAVRTYVNECKVIKVVDEDKIVDMGSWPKGATTKEFTVNYFSGGNRDLTRVKIVSEVSSLTQYLTFTEPVLLGAYPMYVGPVPIREYRKATFHAAISPTAPMGVYSVTFKIFEDANNNDAHDSSASSIEPYDTFTVNMVVGDLDFTITPATLTASPIETSITAITGVVPGFSRLTITNNGMELSRIKMTNDKLVGVKDGVTYEISPDVVQIYPGTLKSPLAQGESDVFDLEVFIAAGTDCATYTTTLKFYSDDDESGTLNNEEKHVDIPLTVYVKPTEKIEVIDKPVSVTGMSSDVSPTYAQVEFLCYNLGNVPLKALKFETNQLVQKDVTTPVTIPMNPSFFEFPTSPYEAPKKTQFSVKLTIPVPAGTPDGVYITTALCSIYNDDGGDYENPQPPNDSLDKSKECYDEFQVWLQIGEMKMVINMSSNNVTGKPGERSTEANFSVKNDGALTITSIIATGTVLTKSSDTVAATASVFLPSENIGTLKAGMEQTRQWAVDIPDCTPAGVYTGKIIAWSDTNGNKLIDVGEASASKDVKLTVESAPKLAIREDSINPVDITTLATPLVTNNATVTVTIRLYNTGNMNITGAIVPSISDLTYLSGKIPASAISVSVESKTLRPYTTSGDYALATITVGLGPSLMTSGHYTGPLGFSVNTGGKIASDSVTLDVEYGIKEMTVAPNPLIFDDLEHVIKQKVTVTKKSAASLKRICAYEKDTPAGCGATTISLETDIPQEITSSKDFYFQVNLDANTAPGTYVATWTFFDDDDKDGLYDSGEYSVDLQIHYVVPERLSMTITPKVKELELKPGDSADILYTVTNTGNANLDNNQLVWRLPPAALVDAEGHTLPQSCFQCIEAPIAPIAAGETGTYTIRVTIPDTQELGTYGPANMSLEYNLITQDTTSITVKVVTDKPGVVVPDSTVHQEVATETWDLTPPNVFFVSAWVCPGLPDAPDKTYANLSMVRYNEDGSPNAALSVRIDNKTRQLQINDVDGLEPEYRVFGDNPSYENTRQTPLFKFHKGSDGKPVCGISGDPVTADDGNGNTLLFYRVYFAFEVEPSAASDPLDPANLLGTERVRILLSESKESETASSTVYFDGIKLEKAIKPDQDRPTTYHQGTTLVSPSNALDISGKHKYYEW